MTNFLAISAGGVVILLVISDIFRALLVPRATTHPLSLARLLGRNLFPIWHAMADRTASPGRRQSTRASFAPLVLVLSLVFWAGLLIAGYGLIFWGLRTSYDPEFVTVGDAVFAAGQAFTTLGLASMTTGTAARVAVIGCGLSGLAIVTVVATFLISVQAGFARREALVLRLEAHVALPPTGVAVLETFAREDVTPRLAAFFEAWEGWGADVALSHRAFPILVFFRSGDSRCEWLAALGAVMDAAALLDAGLADPPPGARAGAHFLLRTGARLLRDVAEQLDVAVGAGCGASDQDWAGKRARLADAGFALVDDAPGARARYAATRDTYAPALVALALRLRITLGDDGS